MSGTCDKCGECSIDLACESCFFSAKRIEDETAAKIAAWLGEVIEAMKRNDDTRVGAVEEIREGITSGEWRS